MNKNTAQSQFRASCWVHMRYSQISQSRNSKTKFVEIIRRRHVAISCVPPLRLYNKTQKVSVNVRQFHASVSASIGTNRSFVSAHRSQNSRVQQSQKKPKNTAPTGCPETSATNYQSSVPAFGTQVRGFKPGRSRRIFQGEKSSARLPLEG
jgi:hypothetical protein